MKKVLIVIGILIVVGLGWVAIQAKPDPSVPKAVVTDVVNNPQASPESKPQQQVEAQPQAQTQSQTQPKVQNPTTKPVENTVVPNMSAKQLDNENVKINFKGFGPGKEHLGSFGKIKSNLSFENGSIKGDVLVDMNSLTSDTEKLTTHLKSKDFFDVASYPTAKFTATSLLNGKLSGVLTIRGISKNVSFGIKHLESLPEQYTSTFTIDMKEFGINQTFANEVVELTVRILTK